MTLLKRLSIVAALGAGLAMGYASGAALAAEPAKEQPKPQLPAGHPELPGKAAPATLPSGHPDIGGAKAPGTLPPGHPPMGGGPGGGNTLPPGHPPMGGGGTGGPATLPPGHPPMGGNGGGDGAGNAHSGDPNATGSLSVKVIQGTKGGPAVSGDTVLVEYYNSQGTVVGKTETKVTDKGEVKIDKIPLAFPVQPLVTVKHAGVPYRAPGNILSARNRDQTMEMSVFEASDQEPDWQVRMRHVIVEPTPLGLNVTEMISVYNPTDRSWTGKPTGNEGKRTTLAITVPAGAEKVQASGGFADDGVIRQGDTVAWTLPLIPGGAEFQVRYLVPPKDGNAEVTLQSPVATRQLLVFLPDDGTGFVSDTLKKLESKPGMKLKEKSRFYTAPPQEKGGTVKFTVTNLKAAKAAATMPNSEPDRDAAIGIPTVAKVVGGVGAAAIVTVGAVIVFFKAPKAAKA